MSEFRTVNTPDGPVRFPAEMSDDDIKAVLRQKYPPPTANTQNPWEQPAAALPAQPQPQMAPEDIRAAQQQMGTVTQEGNLGSLNDAQRAEAYHQQYKDMPWYQQIPTTAYDLADAAASGAAMGMMPKAVAATRSTLGLGTGDYEQELAIQREKDFARQSRLGWGEDVAQLYGGFRGGKAIADKGLTLARVGPKVGPGLTNTLARTAVMVPENLAYGAVEAYGNDQDILSGAGLSAAFGTAGDLVTRAGGNIVKAGRDWLEPFFASDQAGKRAVSKAYAKDITAGNTMSDADFAAGQAAGNPLVNADVGGIATQRLVGDAVTASDEAANLAKPVVNRTKTQYERIKEGWNRMAGVDIDAQQQIELDELERRAKQDRAPLYKAAEAHPNAQAMWDADFINLSKSDDVRKAIKASIREATNVAAIDKTAVIRHPFVEMPDGTLQLKSTIERAKLYDKKRELLDWARKANVPPDPARMAALDKAIRDVKDEIPNLAFWDIVGKELYNIGNTAKKAGKKTSAFNLRKDLLAKMDDATKDASGTSLYKKARTESFDIFQSDNAYEAGQKIAHGKFDEYTVKKGLAKLNPADRDLVELGFAKEELIKLGPKRDKTDLSDLYDSPDYRRKINGLFGAQRAEELFGQMSYENAMQAVSEAAKKNPAGYSQLVDYTILGGIGAGTAYGSTYGGSPGTSITLGGLLAVSKIGLRHKGRQANEATMKAAAKILFSPDPALRAQAMEMAKKSLTFREDLDNIARAMGILSRTGASQYAGEEKQ